MTILQHDSPPQSPQTKRFYVYVLSRPDGRPFYVGKGQGRRVFEHDSEARSGHRCHKCNIIRKIWKQGAQIQRYIMLETDDEQEALEYEYELIALHGRNVLCNQTDGGTGGYVRSELLRAQTSLALKERWSDPEFRAKQSASLKSHYADPEFRAKQSTSLKSKWEDPEFRASRISAVKAQWNDPEFRARVSASKKASWARRKAEKEVSDGLH